MMNFDFDSDKLVTQYTPLLLRQPRHLAWLKVLFVPFKFIKDSFLNFVKASRKEVLQNGQVIILENLLNDLYDNEQRRIFITDASQNVFIISDKTDTIISDTTDLIIPSELDYNFGVDFVVKVFGGGQDDTLILSEINDTIISDTTDLIIGDGSSDMDEKIANTVQQYKISGKTFQIESL